MNLKVKKISLEKPRMKKHFGILLCFLWTILKGHGQVFDPEFSNIDSARRAVNFHHELGI
jgi:hypothetical protein